MTFNKCSNLWHSRESLGLPIHTTLTFLRKNVCNGFFSFIERLCCDLLWLEIILSSSELSGDPSRVRYSFFSVVRFRALLGFTVRWFCMILVSLFDDCFGFFVLRMYSTFLEPQIR